jgi:hypothetical protein
MVRMMFTKKVGTDASSSSECEGDGRPRIIKVHWLLICHQTLCQPVNLVEGRVKKSVYVEQKGEYGVYGAGESWSQ